MINAKLKIPDCNTSEGYIVQQIEIRLDFNGVKKLSGIVRSFKKDSDMYISWDLDGNNPSIPRFGHLILNGAVYV